MIGPTWKGLWGRSEAFDDDSTITVDAEYIRRRLFDQVPQNVRGYSHIMPNFRGQLSDSDIDDLIAFIMDPK